MNKSNYTLSVLSVFILAGFLSCSETRRPNIVLFLVDDMGWQDTSVPFHSERTPFNDLYQTPSMERLAAQGMKFTQAYSHSVCSPTRVSLMSGMNAARKLSGLNRLITSRFPRISVRGAKRQPS